MDNGLYYERLENDMDVKGFGSANALVVKREKLDRQNLDVKSQQCARVVQEPLMG